MNDDNAKMGQLAGVALRRRHNEHRVLTIEQLPGGFIVTDQSGCGLGGDLPSRVIARNIDELFGAIKRWHIENLLPE